MEEKVRHSFIGWLFESPAENLGKGVLLPIALLAGLVAVLVYTPSTPVTTKDGKTVVSYWEKWSGFEGDAIRHAVDAFNRKHDSVHVDLVLQGDIVEKVRIATAGGDPPDLAGLYSFDVPVFASQNALMPLDDMLEEAGIGPDTYVHAYWRLGVYQDTVWTLPTTPSTWALHWNKKLFREAGLDPERPPKTIQELDEYAKKLTKIDKDGHLIQIGFLHTEPGWWKFSWGYWFGGRLWNGKDALTANSPENLKAMEWVKSYVDKYGSKELDRFKKTFGGFSSADNAFFTGKVAMEIQGVWMGNFIKMYAPKDFEWGAAPFPAAVPGLRNVTVAEADVIGIPQGAKHPKEAFEFIKFMATPEGMEILCRGHAKNSPLRNTSADWYTTHPNPFVKVFTDLAESENCLRTPPIGIWREYNVAWQRTFDDVWAGAKEPKQALDELQETMQRRFAHELTRAKALGIELESGE